MVRENMFAYTAPCGSMPEYISINQESEDEISIHIRSSVELGSRDASITLKRWQFEKLLVDSAKAIGGKVLLA